MNCDSLKTDNAIEIGKMKCSRWKAANSCSFSCSQVQCTFLTAAAAAAAASSTILSLHPSMSKPTNTNLGPSVYLFAAIWSLIITLLPTTPLRLPPFSHFTCVTVVSSTEEKKKQHNSIFDPTKQAINSLLFALLCFAFPQHLFKCAFDVCFLSFSLFSPITESRCSCSE